MEGRLPDGVEREDVEVLQVMAEVELAATDPTVPGSPAGGTRADGEALSAAVLASVERARAAGAGFELLGPTRFRFAKRLMLRAVRGLTRKLVEADRALADGLETLALVQNEQVGYARRMSDSLRALVVSADLAMSDAIERVADADAAGGRGVDAPSPGSPVVLLEARVTELEERLARLSAAAAQESAE